MHLQKHGSLTKTSALIGDVVPTGYKFSHTPRIGRRGGGHSSNVQRHIASQ